MPRPIRYEGVTPINGAQPTPEMLKGAVLTLQHKVNFLGDKIVVFSEEVHDDFRDVKSKLNEISRHQQETKATFGGWQKAGVILVGCIGLIGTILSIVLALGRLGGLDAG